MTDPDARFSLANERTFLAWIRTALALIVGGIVAAKALVFDHEFTRWLVAVPPIVVGAALAALAERRWRATELALREDRPIPVGGGLRAFALGLSAYALLVLLAVAVD